MKTLEQRFQEELLTQISAAQAACGGADTRLFQAAQNQNALDAVKAFIQRGTCSRQFLALAQAGHLELTVEALVVKPIYAPLFSDDEVNFCFQLLCEEGFYR